MADSIHLRNISFSNTDDGFEMINVGEGSTDAHRRRSGALSGNSHSYTFVKKFKDDFEQELLKRYEREEMERIQREKEEETRLKQMDEDMRIAKELEKKVEMEQEEERKAHSRTVSQALNNASSVKNLPPVPTVARQHNTLPPVPNMHNRSPSGGNSYIAAQPHQNFSSEKVLMTYLSLVDQGYNETSSRFIVEIYCGDMDKCIDFLKKLSKLTSLGFDEMRSKEALLHFDRDFNKCVDHLTERQNNIQTYPPATQMTQSAYDYESGGGGGGGYNYPSGGNYVNPSTGAYNDPYTHPSAYPQYNGYYQAGNEPYPSYPYNNNNNNPYGPY